MTGRVLGLGAGVVIVALGVWLVWARHGGFPVGLFLAGLGILLLRPVLDLLTLRHGRRDDEEG